MDDRGRPFGEFAHLLPGLVNWVLDMSEAEMREYLMETNNKVKFFAKHHREQILKSNQIMDWLQHCAARVCSIEALWGCGCTSAVAWQRGGVCVWSRCYQVQVGVCLCSVPVA